MPTLSSSHDPRGEAARQAREAMEAKQAEIDSVLGDVRTGGWERYVQRHLDRARASTVWSSTSEERRPK